MHIASARQLILLKSPLFLRHSSFAMKTITIGTPFNIDLEFTTASPGKRILAVLLDMLILSCYMMAIYRFVLIALPQSSEGMNEFFRMLAISILPFIYFPATEILMNGQTPGKKFMGIKVMDATGKEPGISQYLLRWLIGFGNYSVFALPYLIVSTSFGFFGMLYFCIMVIGVFYFPDFLCTIITYKNQRLADLAAGTVIIDIRKKMDLKETIYLEIHDEQTGPRFPEVMRLTDKDLNRIRQLLSQKSNKKADVAYRSMIAERIKAALSIETDMDDIIFMEQLIRDYNYLTQKSR